MVPTLGRNSSLAETWRVSAASEDYYRVLKKSRRSGFRAARRLQRNGRRYLCVGTPVGKLEPPARVHLRGVAYREGEIEMTSKQ